MQHEPVEPGELLVQRRQRVGVQRHEVLAGDEHLHLSQQLVGVVRRIARAVEHEEHVALVVVELRALAEVQSVLERERVKAEQLVQPLEVLGGGRGQIEPEEVIAREVILDRRLIDRGEARDGEIEAGRGCAIGLLRLRLADSHRASVWDASDVIRIRSSRTGGGRVTSFATAAAVLGGLLMLGSLLSGIARRGMLSLAAVFVLAGFLLGDGVTGVLELKPSSGFVSDLASVALIVTCSATGSRSTASSCRRSGSCRCESSRSRCRSPRSSSRCSPRARRLSGPRCIGE